MSEKIPHKTPLSGADYFNLLVERNLQKLGYRGNMVHMVIDLDGTLSEEQLRQRLHQRAIFGWLNAINLRRGYPFQMPNWERGQERKPVDVTVLEETEDVMPDSL